MFIIIAALDHNHAIGHRGQLLFHLKDDLRFFKETTSGHPVVMGRKTWDTLPKKLPNRRNIVISRSPDQISAKPPAAPEVTSSSKPLRHPTSTQTPQKTPANGPKSQFPDQIIANLPDFIEKYQSTPEEYFIIGGAEIYRQFLPVAKQLILTEIATSAPDADAYFPAFDPKNYQKTLIKKGSENGLVFAIAKYVKI